MHGFEWTDHLSKHACGGDFTWFPTFHHRGIDALKLGVGADRIDDGHIKNSSEVSSAAPDGSLVVKSSVISARRGEADQSADLSLKQNTELRQFREQSSGAENVDAGH